MKKKGMFKSVEIVIILAIVLIAIIVGYILALKQISNHIFQCKKCNADFTTNWRKLLFVTHYEDEYNISCPKCGNKGCRKNNKDIKE